MSGRFDRRLCVFSFVLLFLACGAQAYEVDSHQRASSANQAFWVEEFIVGLDQPSAMTWLPNGDMLITGRKGDLRIARGGKLDPSRVDGVPRSYPSLWDGFKDVVVDPNFEVNKTLYLLISEGTFESRHAAVYRARLINDRLESVRRIFRSNDEVGGYAMFVTRMILLTDGTLLVAIAEDHRDRAQKLDSHMGKVLRINRDGSVPKDNPFLGTPRALPEIWSYGHRAPLGLYQDPDSGEIWEVESGPSGGDELNILKAGRNYGWATASWGFSYGNNGLDAPVQSGPGIEDPVLVWTPSVTPSGLRRYRGKVYPLWSGDYFLGQLTTRAIERLRIDGHRVVLQERMLLDLDERIRDVQVGPDDHLYVLTDHQNSRVLRLRPGRPHEDQHARVAQRLEAVESSGGELGFLVERDDLVADLGEDELARGRLAFIERCAGCHSIGSVIRGGEIGPDLEAVYGRQMGRMPGFNYSSNMSGAVFIWKFGTLNKFLADPLGLVPGTRMTSPPVTDPQLRRAIIGFLRQQSSNSR